MSVMPDRSRYAFASRWALRPPPRVSSPPTWISTGSADPSRRAGRPTRRRVSRTPSSLDVSAGKVSGSSTHRRGAPPGAAAQPLRPGGAEGAVLAVQVAGVHEPGQPVGGAGEHESVRVDLPVVEGDLRH